MGIRPLRDDPIFNLKVYALIYGGHYDGMMAAFGGKDPKDLRGAFDEATSSCIAHGPTRHSPSLQRAGDSVYVRFQ
jgi:hypothetical protein